MEEENSFSHTVSSSSISICTSKKKEKNLFSLLWERKIYLIIQGNRLIRAIIFTYI